MLSAGRTAGERVHLPLLSGLCFLAFRMKAGGMALKMRGRDISPDRREFTAENWSLKQQELSILSGGALEQSPLRMTLR